MIKDTMKKVFPRMAQRVSAARVMHLCRKNAALDPSQYRQAAIEWYRKRQGRIPDLDNPTTFDEKIQWLKLYNATPEKGRLSDKYLVRDWVANTAGEQYLVDLLGVWEDPDDIDLDALPQRFVLKATHGCYWNIIVEDKDALDWELAKRQLRSWLGLQYAFVNGFELQYLYCEPRIIAEEYLCNASGGLDDYKFFCFGGEVACIGHISGRYSTSREACYDAQWHRLPCVYYRHPRADEDSPPPVALEEALHVARTLSAGFPHVRVDLYLLDDGSVRFGEMTFTTLSGDSMWDPPEYNDYFGSLIDLGALPEWKGVQGQRIVVP